MRKFILDDNGIGMVASSIEMMKGDGCRSVVVVCPARKEEQWKMRIYEHGPDVRCFMISRWGMIYDGERIRREFRHPKGQRFFVISYDSMPVLEELLKDVPEWLRWGVIFDESHYLKSPKSLRHRRGVKLSRMADSVLMLTMTPILSSVEDICCQCMVLYPDKRDRVAMYGNGFASLKDFRFIYGMRKLKINKTFSKVSWDYQFDDAIALSERIAPTITQALAS